MIYPILILIGLPIILGLCSSQLMMVLKVSAAIGALWAMLAMALLEIAVGFHAPGGFFVPTIANAAELLGVIVGTMLLGLLGHGIRRGFGALRRLFSK